MDTPSEPDAESRAIPHWYAADGDVLTLVDGDGATVYDDEGGAYLDFMSQLYCVNAGHSNDAIVDAMAEQARKIPYVSSAKGNPARSELAGRIADVAPGDLSDVYFAVSGSEANEAAVQFAREYADGTRVLTRWRSYHGSTYGAAGLTGDPETRATVERHAAVTGNGKFLPPIPAAFPGADTPEELADRAADHLEFVLKNEGPDSVAAVLTEPVAGTSGAFPAPPGYFERVREICDEYDVLLVADEVIAGFGRCGEWFGVQTDDVVPDLLTFAKGVTSAYAPLAGVVANDDVGSYLRAEGVAVGQTFAGHPVSCAAGVAALDAYADGLIDNVRSLEPRLRDRLESLESDHDAVSAVHGRGFLWSVEFADPDTGERFVDPRVDEGDNPVAAVREAAQAEGALFGSGRPDFQVMVAPPLCATEDELDRGVAALETGIEATFE